MIRYMRLLLAVITLVSPTSVPRSSPPDTSGSGTTMLTNTTVEEGKASSVTAGDSAVRDDVLANTTVEEGKTSGVAVGDTLRETVA